MRDLIERQAAIDAFMTATSDGDKAEWCKWVLTQVPSAQPNLQQTCNQLATDCISRQAAIDVLEERLQSNGYTNVALVSELNKSIGYMMQLPSTQPERRFDEWCTDCKEYDNERHCCPRFNHVIRTTLQEVQQE